MLAVEEHIGRTPVSFDDTGPDVVDDDAYVLARQRLQKVKESVPFAQRRMGVRRWHALVNVPGPMERMNSGKRLVNRAYHKMHEILLTCALPPTTRSLHLCEAPGGFVQCVSDHMATPEWVWVAVTLQHEQHPTPSQELLPYDRGSFLMHDILDGPPPVSDVAAFDLVTADGATHVDHGRLEELHRPLLIAQCTAAVCFLSKGGTLVVKFFEGLQRETRRIVAWVSNHFEQTSIIKPTSSRATNSERYLVCRRFLADGAPRGDPCRCQMSVEWDRQLQTVLKNMADVQRIALQQTGASELDTRR